jgi:hypothetical protein
MQVIAVMMKVGGAGLVLPYVDQFRDLIEAVGSTHVSQAASYKNVELTDFWF